MGADFFRAAVIVATALLRAQARMAASEACGSDIAMSMSVALRRVGSGWALEIAMRRSLCSDSQNSSSASTKAGMLPKWW